MREDISNTPEMLKLKKVDPMEYSRRLIDDVVAYLEEELGRVPTLHEISLALEISPRKVAFVLEASNINRQKNRSL